MKIAVDFDGTLVEHAYPGIGKAIPFAIETLRRLQKNHLLILWTVREGALLQDAVEYCRRHGVEFYAVNSDSPEDVTEYCCRKLNADLFIDDRNIGGLPDWGLIYRMVQEKITFEELFLAEAGKVKRNGFMTRLRNCFSLKKEIGRF